MVGNNYEKTDMSAQQKRAADHASRYTNDRRKSDQKPKPLFERGSKFPSPNVKSNVKTEAVTPTNEQRGQTARPTTTGTQPGQAGDRQGSQTKKQQPPPSPNKGGDADAADGKGTEKKFTGRCRLFVGNLPNDTTEDEFKKMFSPFGLFTEIYLNTSRGFGFIRMDTRQNAENAKATLDGFFKKGRLLRVRFATHGAALRVKYLSPCVSNELLEKAFALFGEIERAIVIVDDRGKATGEGIVEFARKPGAQSALRRINEGVFLLSASPRPVVVEMLEQKDEIDGLPEKFMNKNPDFAKEREQAPRFAQPGLFEFEFGQKWKDLYAIHHEQEENLKRDLEESEVKLEMDMANAQLDHQANLLRQDLVRRQEELRKLEEQRSVDMQHRLEIRRMEDDRRHQESEARRQDLEMRRQQIDGRRHQQLLAQQERAMREMRGERGGNAPPLQPPPAPPASMGLERPNRNQGQQSMGMNQGHNQGMGGPNITSLVGGQTPGAGGMGPGSSPGMTPGMPNAQMRQSRFDQPPNFQSNMGGPIGNMGANMGQQGGSMIASMNSQPNMQQIGSLMGGPPMGMGLGTPNMGRGPMGGERGAPMGNERGAPMGNERGAPGNERGAPGNERGPMGGERGPMGGERGPMGGERGPMGGERGPMGNDRNQMGNERGPMGNERGPMGNERGPMGNERGPMGNERGMDRPAGGRADRGRDEFFDSKRPRRF